MHNISFIINADDFGRSKSRNEAIAEIIEKGMCHRVSLMVNMGDSTDEAVKLAFEKSFSDRICLHLNLMFGKPLTDPIKETLLCKNGFFSGLSNNIIITKRGLNRKVISAIRIELDAQMKLFSEFGFKNTHIDSHMWGMCNIPVVLAILSLRKKYQFASVRALRGHIINKNNRFIINLFFCFIQFLYRLIGFKVSENWSGCTTEFIKVASDELRLRKMYEVYVHPDYCDSTIVDTVYKYPNIIESYDLVYAEINSIK